MYEKAKTKKFVNVLIGYFFRHQIINFDLEVRMDDEKTEITIRGKTDRIIAGIDKICMLCNVQRKVEMEDYYDELLGMRDTDDDLELMSYMLDEASLSYENQLLTFTVVRLRVPHT